MNIFDAHISGSLSVSSSAEISGDLTVLGTINATISGTTSNALTASEAPKYTLTSSFGNFTSSYTTGSFTGSFEGNGSGLHSIPASGVTGLNLNKIISGSVSASISPNRGFEVNTDATFTGSVNITGSIYLNGNPIGTGKLDETTFNTYTGNTSSTIATLATTGSNLFKGTQTHSGSILPSVDNTYDLGSAEYQWRDVYISSGSLYIDGTKVISSTAQELVITTDNGQSIKILESTTDSIILQTADGDIELKSSADGDILLDPTNGKIMLKGPVEILNGQKIQSSVGGTPVVFANDIVVSGSIDITGTIEGINLTDFSSSVNSRLGSLESTTVSLNSYTSSNTTNINAIQTATSSLNSFTSSINTTIKSKLDSDGVISGSVQVNITGTTGYSTFSSSVSSSIGSLSSSIATTTSELSSSIGSLSSSVTTTTNGLSSSIGSLSSSVASTDLALSNRITVLDLKTGSYATTGSNIFQGNQTITGSLYVSQDLIIAGSSSIQHISSSVVNIADNIITVNAQNPAQRFGGLSVIDSGSSPQVSGSLLFDATENEWIFVHQNQLMVTSALLIMGPETYNDLGNEIHLTNNRLVKSTNDEHIGDSNISDNGTNVSINSNTNITGSLLVTSTIISQTTPLVSGSAQISFNGITDKPTLVSGSSQVLSGTGIWSGSSQLPSGVVSGSSQVLSGTGIWSGSAQLPSGVVSGSSQVLVGTTIHSGAFFNGITVVSGSAQISFNGITDKPTLVSGSSQITFGSISSIPGGLVSGSSQIDLTATTNYSTGIKTRLNAEGVISGSAQVSFSSITGIPSGLVSGSSQITSIANSQLTNSSFFVGTTSISLGRTSASQTLSGVSIDGNAATVTHNPSRTDATYYNVGWFAGASSPVYSCDAVQIQSSTGTLRATTFSGALSGNATTATNLSNTGTVTLGQSTENNAITITQPSYTTDTPVKLLNFDWYGNTWSLGNIRSSATPSSGLGVYATGVEKFRFTTTSFLINGNTALHTGNYTSYSPSLTGANASGTWGINVTGTAGNITAYTINQSVGTGNSPSFNYIKLTAASGGSTTVNGTVGLKFSGLSDYDSLEIGINNNYDGMIRTYGNDLKLYAGHWKTTSTATEDHSLYFYTSKNGSTNWSTAKLRLDHDGHLTPGFNGTQNLGSSSLRWNTVFTSDLSMSNGIGDYTIVEGEEDLFIYNNKTNKVFKFLLQEVDPSIVPPKKI